MGHDTDPNSTFGPGSNSTYEIVSTSDPPCELEGIRFHLGVPPLTKKLTTKKLTMINVILEAFGDLVPLTNDVTDSMERTEAGNA